MMRMTVAIVAGDGRCALEEAGNRRENGAIRLFGRSIRTVTGTENLPDSCRLLFGCDRLPAECG
jgi:hypothetical protein